MAGVAGSTVAHTSCVVIRWIVAIVFAMNWCDGLYTDISVGVVVVARFGANHSGVRLVGDIAVIRATNGSAAVTVDRMSD